MEIEIQNCNNIDLAKIQISTNKLNIKFAPNGTGKSTIAKAIDYSSKGDAESLEYLTPFKYKESNPENRKPEVTGADEIENTMCFNEDYVDQFLFVNDELVSNSFDIFIRTEDYRKIEDEIEEIVSTIKNVFADNRGLETLIATLKELNGAFKLTKSGISKSSTGMKGLSGGNKIKHIPAGLEPFKPFIQSQNSVGWIDWQIKGVGFLELSDSCPFCTSEVTEKKEQIEKVGQEYDKNIIKNRLGLLKILENLGEYFSEETKSKLELITELKDDLEKEHIDFIATVKTQIDNLVQKLESLKLLVGFDFKDGEQVSEKLPLFKLDLKFFSEINSEKTKAAIAPINSSIDVVIQQAGQLQGKINIQRRQIEEIVERHQNDINGFLEYAGYKYKVEIFGEEGSSRLKLLHIDHSEHLSSSKQHLSFGERNAFAIVLFMYECLAKSPDLIILDDPISSFDKNKKYAILEMLFRRDSSKCLKNKTVLMLTHDVEPIIDTIKSLSQKFKNQTSAAFLNLISGSITEKAITKGDIKTFPQICRNVLNSDKDNLIKLIYFRRYCEIIDDKENAYQVLSNLFHKREKAEDRRAEPDEDGNYPELSKADFLDGGRKIADKIGDFEYDDFLNKVSDIENLKEIYSNSVNGYEKLQLFRLLGLDIPNSVVQKFINETYHIENEFICQLDPCDFDPIPEYIISECDRQIHAMQN